jgi:two-component system, cell cycle response regulator
VRAVVVDPSRVVLKCVSQMLADRNYETRAFVDGREALEYLRSDPEVGVLITSTEPISISGAELCWEARLLASALRPIHIIVMSSNDDQKHLVEALDGGADDFIRKPPASEELHARLRCAERLASMQRQLIRLATTDPLTGVLNRRAFFERAAEAFARVEAGAGMLSAVMFDIDHFKRVNDSYGHGVGDETLCSVAGVAADHSGVVGRGVVGRLGGEEFAILLEGADLPAAVQLAAGLRAKIAELRIATEQGPLAVTCSLGVGERTAGDTVDRLLKRADVALYRAKQGGRNRVVAADESAESNGNPYPVTRAAMRGRSAA